MVQRKDDFADGIKHFRAGQMDLALNAFTRAIQLGAENHRVYDSRAATYEKLDRTADALRDSKRVIDLAPTAWQGYTRAARLFMSIKKHPQAIKMANMALDRLKADDDKRRLEMQAVKESASAALSAAGVCRSDHARPVEKIDFFGRLPIEIGTSIFVALNAENPSYPILLSHVCRQWRRSIHNTPALWSMLILSNKKPALKTDLWLKNSKRRLKEIHIRHSFVWRLYTDVFQKLRALDWKSLRVFTTEHDVKQLTELLELAQLHSFDGLHRLEIRGKGGAADDPWRWVDLVRKADIRALTLDNTLVWWQRMCVSVGRLRELTIVSCIEALRQGDTLISLLCANPLLETLHLEQTNLTVPPRTAVGGLPVVYLPHLRSLTFTRLSSAANAILEAIQAPALEVLALTQLGSIEAHLQRLADSALLSIPTALGEDEGVVVASVRPLSRLTELRIQSCGFCPRTLVALLQHTPALTTLQAARVAEVAAVLQWLAEPRPLQDVAGVSGTGILTLGCPLLQHVDVSHSGDVSSGPVNRLVAARLPVDADGDTMGESDGGVAPKTERIRSLVLDGCPRVEVGTLPWLRKFVERVSCVYATKASFKR